MGGQACVLYGAAEFSRDVDLALLPDPSNLDRLTAATADLQTETVAVPPFAMEHLEEVFDACDPMSEACGSTL